MTQKLYRDSKGRFVGRERLVSALRIWIDMIQLLAGTSAVMINAHGFEIYPMPRGELAHCLRQFRNQYKIYECF